MTNQWLKAGNHLINPDHVTSIEWFEDSELGYSVHFTNHIITIGTDDDGFSAIDTFVRNNGKTNQQLATERNMDAWLKLDAEL